MVNTIKLCMAKKWIVIKMSSSNYLKDNKKLMKEYDYKTNATINLNDLKIGSNKKILVDLF